ncbi:MAG TPA: extracellular solute-binding protein, partial [Firmicutes bacterium]|nr:extracellular solute-binding protein [Bacillota bacterium]
LDDPYELYLAGEWDWDAFTEAAKVLTADTTGDGNIDRWAIDMIMEEDLVIANDGRYAREIDGRAVFTGDEPAVIEALVQNDEWINAGYYRGWGPEAFADGEIGMMFLEMWRLRDHVNPNTGEWEIDFELGIVPYPKGPSAARNVYPTETILYYSLPSNSGDPEAMVALLDALYPSDAIFDEAEEAFMEWAPSREAFGVLMESVVEWDGWIDIYQPMMAPWTPEGQTWSAYMAAVKQAKQAILDDLFN